MNRLYNAVTSISESYLNSVPRNLQPFVKIYCGCIALLVGSIIGVKIMTPTTILTNKVVRWIKGDSIKYVEWDDLKGQLDRLAKERFDSLKGALAPVEIYDRNNSISKAAIRIFNGYFVLKEKVGSVVGVSVGLLAAGYWHQKCHQLHQSDQCWNHLGFVFKEPAFLALLATAYSVTQVGVPAFDFGFIAYSLPVLYIAGLGSGVEKKNVWGGYQPTRAQKSSAFLLEERYQSLAENLSQRWEEAKKNEDLAVAKSLVRIAELLDRRMLLVQLGLNEYFDLTNEQCKEILSPLIVAVKKIILESSDTLKKFAY